MSSTRPPTWKRFGNMAMCSRRGAIYVGAEELEDDGEVFEEKMQRLTETLREQVALARELDAAIEITRGC